MYILLALIVLLTIGIALYRFLGWTFEESLEDGGEADRGRDTARFYNPQAWSVFNRLFPQRPPLLGYRRDKRGRFRKMR